MPKKRGVREKRKKSLTSLDSFCSEYNLTTQQYAWKSTQRKIKSLTGPDFKDTFMNTAFRDRTPPQRPVATVETTADYRRSPLEIEVDRLQKENEKLKKDLKELATPANGLIVAIDALEKKLSSNKEARKNANRFIWTFIVGSFVAGLILEALKWVFVATF